MLAYYIPMEDREIEVKVEQVTDEEFRKLNFDRQIWFSHAKAKRARNIGGCPFHRK